MKNLHGLIVAGNPQTRKELTELFEHYSCAWTLAEDTMDAVRKGKSRHFDLVVADDEVKDSGVVETAMNLSDIFSEQALIFLIGKSLDKYRKIWRRSKIFCHGSSETVFSKLENLLEEDQEEIFAYIQKSQQGAHR